MMEAVTALEILVNFNAIFNTVRRKNLKFRKLTDERQTIDHLLYRLTANRLIG
jgi:uncharacterized protein YdcH (DUF465 family)